MKPITCPTAGGWALIKFHSYENNYRMHNVNLFNLNFGTAVFGHHICQ